MSDKIMSNINELWIQVTLHGHHKVSDKPYNFRVLGLACTKETLCDDYTTTKESQVAAMNNEPSSNVSRTRNAGLS